VLAAVPRPRAIRFSPIRLRNKSYFPRAFLIQYFVENPVSMNGAPVEQASACLVLTFVGVARNKEVGEI
jgi:hypothetical protein